MVMLTFTVDKDNKLLDVKKSKEKGLFESKKDQAYADKVLKKLKKEKMTPMTEEEEYKNAGFVKGTK